MRSAGTLSVGLAALLFTACGDVAPTRPSTVTSSLTISVTDGMWRPLQDATVEIEDGNKQRFSKTTDSAGQAVIGGTWTNPITVRASKGGFVPSSAVVSVAGNRASSTLALASAGPTMNLAPGEYSLTLEIDDACAGIPEDLRTRRYDATVNAWRVPSGETLMYVVNVSGPTLFSRSTGAGGLLYLGVSGNDVALSSGDDVLYEDLPSHAYLEFAPGGTTSVDDLNAASLSVPYTGFVYYCLFNSPRDRSTTCETAPASQITTRESCKNASHTIVLARR